MAINDDSKTGAQAGSTDRLEAVMEAYESALLRYTSGLLRNWHAAQDVVQNVFIKFLRHADVYSLPPERLRSWFFRVAHNEAVDYIRRETRLRRLHESQSLEEEAQQRDAAEDKAAAQMELISDAISHLDAPEREVLLLRLQEGLSYREISRATGRSEGNVGCLLHHAVRKLAVMVKQSSAAEKKT